jgi:hypothetical protein
MEYWKKKKTEFRRQETEQRGQSHRTSEARGQEDNGNTNTKARKGKKHEVNILLFFVISSFSCLRDCFSFLALISAFSACSAVNLPLLRFLGHGAAALRGGREVDVEHGAS